MTKLKQLTFKSWDNIVNSVCRQHSPILKISLRQFNPCVDDVLMQDIDAKDLYDKISKQLGKPYLQPLMENQLEFQCERSGIIYGLGNRGFISLPTRTSKTAPIWIHYLIDTRSPYNFLSEVGLKALNLDTQQNKSCIYIQGRQCTVFQSAHQFSNANILGMNYLLGAKSLNYDLEQFKFTLTYKAKE